MLQLRFVPVSQGTWVFVLMFIWIRADLSTCTNALLNHGLNLHAGHNLNPVENTHEAAANPNAQQCRNFSKNSVWCLILCILPSKNTLYHSCITANSWLTARGSFWLPVRAKGRSGQVCHTPQALRKLQKCSCSQHCYLGHAGLSSDSRDKALLPWGSAGHQSHCRMLWASRACCGALGSWASRGAPQQWVHAGHTSLSDVFILLRCKLTGWTLPLCLL